MLLKLTGDSRLGNCATKDCDRKPVWRLEAYGVGSNYCSICKDNLCPAEIDWFEVAGEQGQRAMAAEAEVERLRAILRHCMGGVHVVKISPIEVIGLCLTPEPCGERE